MRKTGKTVPADWTQGNRQADGSVGGFAVAALLVPRAAHHGVRQAVLLRLYGIRLYPWADPTWGGNGGSSRIPVYSTPSDEPSTPTLAAG